jgi:magnesium chelatase subunit I
VGLFNILQEGDVQIKGYPVRLPLDVFLVFSANPEDYTARGKIITPLKDRIGSEIRTHYPVSRADAMAITAQEAWLDRGESAPAIEVPSYVREIVEEIAFQARADAKVDKRSGVSQRLPITALENVVSNAERRALAAGEELAVPRVTDVYTALPSLTGKIELEYEGELRGAATVASDIIRAAVSDVAMGYIDAADTRPIVDWFETGGTLQLTDAMAAEALVDETRRVEGLHDLARRAVSGAGDSPERMASAVDFVLEGLYAQKKISRSDDWRYAAAEGARRAGRREPSLDADPPLPGSGRRKYYN